MAEWLEVLADFGAFGLLLFAAVTLAWFVWHVFGRKYYRAWHIARIRERREMRELLDR